jgi:GNAT superfamily N-acetyltransferase
MSPDRTPPSLSQFTAPEAVDAALRAELTACWTAVLAAGGAVVSAALSLPPVSRAAVAAEVDRVAASLSPDRRMVVARVGGTLAGWLVVAREPHPLMTHTGTVNHVQSSPAHRGTGVGAALMRHAATVARDGMGLERLRLSARSGLGLEAFYGRLGWKEIGRWPRAIRVAPDDDRDDALMHLEL